MKYHQLVKVGLILAILLLLCLLPMPYGFYNILRFVAMIVFGCFAYCFYEDDKKVYMILAGSLALLFQPFFKITLDKVTWNIIDILTAIALFYLWHKEDKEQTN